MKRKLLIAFAAGLIICCGFSFQNNFLEKLQEKLSWYYETNIPLKISLFLNQPTYAPSDTVYFRIDLLTEADSKPVGGFAVININLVNNESKITHHQKIRIKDGMGFSQIAISPNVKPGLYTLVAYNDWMKNHDQSLYAFYEINIAGEKILTRNSQNFDFNFFSEGGNLIEGITNKILFTGKPFEKVKVSNSTGIVFPEVTLNENGLGTFFLTPKKHTVYKAIMGEQVKNLDVKTDGVGLLMKISPSDTSVRCILQILETSRLREGGVYFVLSKGQHIYYGAKVDFKKSTQGMVNIPGNQVPKGLSLITVFDHSESILAQRLIKIPESLSTEVKLMTDRKTYGVREKVTITVNDLTGGNSFGWMTVFNTDLFETEEINAYRKQSDVMLKDLPFNGLQVPKKIFEDRGFVQLNDFLISQPWTGYLWKNVLNGVTKNHFPFRQDIFITGKAAYQDGRVFLDSTQIAFFLQKDGMVYQIYTDRNGNFDFPLLFDFYGEEEVYYRVENSNRILNDVDIEISSDTLSIPFNNPFSWQPDQNKYAVFSTNKNTVNTAYAIPRKSILSLSSINHHANIEEEVLGVDVTVQLKDYVLFPTMEETLLEIIPYLRHQKRYGRSVVKLWLDDNTIPKHDPLYMIDGVLTDDTDYFMSLLPANVISIKLIRSVFKLKKLGIFGRNGIVLVETKIPDNYLKVSRSEKMFSMEGLTKSKPPGLVITENLKERTPIIQSTLYFNPHFETDENGNATVSFYTADNTGNFKIFVQGIHTDGRPFRIEHDFEVKFNPKEN